MIRRIRNRLRHLRRGARWLKRDWAKRIPYRYAVRMMGGSRRRGVTLHDEGERRRCNGRHDWLAEYVNSRNVPYHALWCGSCGYWAQLIPFHKAAYSLKGGAIAPNGASANKFGRRNIQICLVGVANGRDGMGKKFTDGPMVRAWVLAEIMDAHKIPWRARKVWGAGSSRSLKSWKVSGVHGHQHSPARYEDHTDPGDIDVEKLFRVARHQQRRKFR